MDAQLMERLFSSEQGLHTLPTAPEDLPEESREKLGRILENMSRISPLEADLLELYLLKGVSQAQLGKIFQYTQPNIHYRIARGIQRLKVFINIEMYTEEELRERLGSFFTDRKDIDVLVLIYTHSSQSLVARIIGESQGKVRYRYLKCIKALEQSPSLSDVYLSLKCIGDNITLLRRHKEDDLEKKVIL